MKQANLTFAQRILFFLLVLCTVITAVQGTVFTAFAAESVPFEQSNVLDDLRASTVNGQPFNLSAYPFDENGSPHLINFVEYCYSFRGNMRNRYGLYVYIYNPQGLNIVENSNQNKIQIGTYTDDDGNLHYEKFRLEFVNKSESPDYKGLFYKFKVIDRVTENGKKIVENVNSNERKYCVSGFELLTQGQQNATEYGVGGTYVFTGYCQGYGPAPEAESTLSCTAENLETLELEVHHTYFRTNVSNLGKDHFSEINTVYFSVPDRVFKTYGNLQKIRAEWWEYKTKMAAVTSNQDYYNKLLQYIGTDIGEYDAGVDNYLYSGYSATGGTTIGSPLINRFDWTYNQDLSTKKSAIGTITEINYCDRVSNILPLVFYSPAVDLDTVFKFLYSKPIAGNVESSVVTEWIYNYSNSLGHGYVDYNGRQISRDLFEDSVDPGRTMGYNDKTIDLSDTFDLMSYDSNHSWWDKLWDYGFSWPQTDGDYTNVSPIYEVKASDLVGSNAQISANLLVNADDVSALQAYYATESAKGNHVILFRFASTDYYSAPAFRKGFTGSINNTDTYVAQQTVFLDFDIIELTFNKDGVYHVIPVVSSPIDVINGYDAPATEFQWWKVLVALLFAILLLIILMPAIPYIAKAIWWFISFPFKLIGGAVKKAKERKREKDKGD